MKTNESIDILILKSAFKFLNGEKKSTKMTIFSCAFGGVKVSEV